MKISQINFGQYKSVHPRGHQKAYPKKTYDGLEIYRQDIIKYPRVTREEEINLSRKLKANGKDVEKAREKLILANLRMAYSIAKKYYIDRLPLEDLIQVSNMGLMDAADKNYDGSHSFSTYAYYKILKRIAHEIGINNRIIRIPHNILIENNKIRKFINQFEQTGKKNPDIHEISQGTGIPEDRIKQITEYMNAELSLNNTIDKGSDTLTEYIDKIANDEAVNPIKELELKELKEDIRCAVDTSNLTPQQKNVIVLIYGLSEEGAKTPTEVANKLNISSQRVNQLRLKAFYKLRRNKLVKIHRDIFN